MYTETIVSALSIYMLYKSYTELNMLRDRKYNLSHSDKVNAILLGNFENFEVVMKDFRNIKIVFIDFPEKNKIDEIIEETHQKYKSYQENELLYENDALCEILAEIYMTNGYELVTNYQKTGTLGYDYSFFDPCNDKVDVRIPTFYHKGFYENILYIVCAGNDKKIAMLIKTSPIE